MTVLSGLALVFALAVDQTPFRQPLTIVPQAPVPVSRQVSVYKGFGLKPYIPAKATGMPAGAVGIQQVEGYRFHVQGMIQGYSIQITTTDSMFRAAKRVDRQDLEENFKASRKLGQVPQGMGEIPMALLPSQDDFSNFVVIKDGKVLFTGHDIEDVNFNSATFAIRNMTKTVDGEITIRYRVNNGVYNTTGKIPVPPVDQIATVIYRGGPTPSLGIVLPDGKHIFGVPTKNNIKGGVMFGSLDAGTPILSLIAW